MTMRESRNSQKGLLRMGLVLTIFMTLAVWQINTPIAITRTAFAQKGPVFDIVPDSSTLSGTLPTGSSFFLTGKIYRFGDVNKADCTLRPGAEVLGIWRAWGTVADGGRLVMHQTLALEPLNGTLEIQGVTGLLAASGDVGPAVPGTSGGATTGPSEILTLTGGSGRFSGLDGEANVRPYCNPTSGGTSPFRYDRAFCLGVE